MKLKWILKLYFIQIKYEESNDCELSWFDDDLHPVSLQAQREAEELRLKQLQIEQEVSCCTYLRCMYDIASAKSYNQLKPLKVVPL